MLLGWEDRSGVIQSPLLTIQSSTTMLICAYDAVDGVTQAAYMVHVRRKFTDAQKASPSKKAGKPEKALAFIAKLYGIEKRAKDLSADARQQMRMQESLPILNDFKAWLIACMFCRKGH